MRQAHSYRRWRALRDRWNAPAHDDEVADPQPRTSDPLLRGCSARALASLRGDLSDLREARGQEP